MVWATEVSNSSDLAHRGWIETWLLPFGWKQDVHVCTCMLMHTHALMHASMYEEVPMWGSVCINIYLEAREQHLSTVSPVLTTLFVWGTTSHWSRACQLGCASWPVSPKGLPVSPSSRSVHHDANFLNCILRGTKPRSLWPHGKCFTD